MEASSRRLSVLMVEDDASIGEMYGIAIRQAGLDFTLACDGTRGLELARSMHPDLVILDIKLPDGDGIDILAAMKASAEVSDVPVLMFSNSCDELRDRALKLGAVACAIKVETTPSVLARSVLHWASQPAAALHA